MDHVKFGVIGAGGAWSFHSNACLDSPVVRFTAIFDVNRKLAVKTAKMYDKGEMKAFDDIREFLKSDIDAVLITVPHAYHEGITAQAAAAGKHILCEKPMATTLEGCDMMIEAARRAGVKFMIAENHRFLPAHRYIHDAVRQGLIGDVLLVRAYEGVNEIAGLTQPTYWKGDPIKAGGGTLMDMGAHKFATLEWILDDRIESISALLAKQEINLPEKAEDNSMAMFRFSKGVIGEVCVSFTQYSPCFNSLELYGSSGTILENHMWERPVRIFSDHPSMGEHRQQWFEPEIEHAPYPRYYAISARNEDEHFARCIIENKEPEFTPEQAKSAITAIHMGYLSSQMGRTVTREELLELAKNQGTKGILESLTKHIRQSPRLPEVKRMESTGYSKKRAQEIMAKNNLDLFIATTPVNVFYTTGLPTLHSAPNSILFALRNQYPSASIIRNDGEVALFKWDLFQSVDKFSWVADYKGTTGQNDVKRSVVSKIKKWGMMGKRIGVESTAPKYLLDQLIKKNAASEITTADEVLLDLRLIKSGEEIRRIEEVTRITEKAVTTCMKAAREGVSDNDFLLLARKTMIEEGADSIDHLTLSIGNSDPEAPGLGTIAKKGDIIRFDFGAAYKGYVGDVNRHVILGPVPGELAELIEKLIMLQEYYEKNAKPGVNIRQLNDEATAWYNKLKSGGMTFVVGHSIGLECEEQHLFGPLKVLDREFEKNMVFEIEAWEPYGDTLVGVEDCYVVTGDGLRRITTLDKRVTSV